MFDRNRLQKIREEALSEFESVNSIHWCRALLNLADAADRLDAMLARAEDFISVKEISKNTTPTWEDSRRLVKEVGRRRNSPRQNKISEELDCAIGEGIHPYFCVQHGGSDACERLNKKNGLTCPECDQNAIVKEIGKEV
ncbi:MAG: hypothetical protein IMZ47_03085 [Firmicutes bacterium]|nr:hypothetical protein [Bacillota bacterium]